MHMATLQYLLQEIFMLMSSCISTIERMFLMNFSIRNYSSCPIIGESHNICVSCSCPWAWFHFHLFTFPTNEHFISQV